MRPTYEFPELPVLHGALMTWLSDDEFFELCQAKWEQLTPEQRRKFPPVCPEVMMEIESPSDDMADLQAKLEIYLANGMQLGFLLDVPAETVYIYRPGQPAESVQGYDQELSGEPVRPSFQLDLRPLRRSA